MASTLTEYFQKIIARQKEIGYGFPDLLNAPATGAQIAEAENELQLHFNPELKELYLLANGADSKGLPSGKTGLIPIHDFMDLSSCIVAYNNYTELKDDYNRRLANEEMDAFYNYNTGYIPGPKLFPFLTDGGGNHYWVDLNEGHEYYGMIYWTNTFGDPPAYTYASLTAMLQTILACYEQGIISLDANGYLDCDYDKEREVAKKLNPDISYWDDY
jgi:cell wall assembly regulator SMI1